VSPRFDERKLLILQCRFFLVPCVAAVVACDRAGAHRSGDTAHTIATVKSTAAWYLDTAEGCEFLATRINEDAYRLVEEYVRRDSQGAFLATNRWLDSAYLCPGHLPGPDAFTAISTTTITELDRSDSLVRYFVRSTQLGDMTQDSIGFIFGPRSGTAADTFVVRQTPYGWRIESPQLPDRVSVDWILSHADRLRFHGPSIGRLRAISRPDT
jgi:hypothetical protein